MSHEQQGIEKPSGRRGSRRAKLRDPRLYWRGATIWCRVLDPEGSGTKVRLTTKCRDEAAAREKANEYERLAASPSYRATQATMTLKEGVESLQLAMRSERCALSTIATVTNRLGNFIAEWGEDFPLSSVDGARVQLFVNKRLTCKGRNGTLSHVTLGVDIHALRRLLRHAAYIDRYHRSVDAVVPMKKWGERARNVKRFPTQDQAWAILRGLPARAASQVAFILGTGCRAEEARRARASDISESLVEVHATKTRHAREFAKEVPITSIGQPFLAFALANAKPDGGLLFTVSQGSIRTMIRASCKRLGIGPFSPNDLRRAFCQWHKAGGFSEEVQALLLRHQDTTMVREVYGQNDANGSAIIETMKKEASAKGLHVVPVLYQPTSPIGPVATDRTHATQGNSLDSGNAAE